MTLERTSYRLHLDRIDDGEEVDAAVFTHPDSIDAWHQRRMYRMVAPLLEDSKDDLWLTIGDFARSDAAMLQELGCRSVVASDIASPPAGKFRKRDIAFAAMNAERLPLAEGSVDYVFCKEAYHHFPRPPVAFYEMLRVARKGVILIEPQVGPARFLDGVKRIAKIVLRGRENARGEYEPSGNYIYRIGFDELRRAAIAVDLPALAWRPFNNFFIPRHTRTTYRPFSLHTSTFHLGLAVQDLLAALRLLDFGLAVAVVFRVDPGRDMAEKMRAGRFRFVRLPRNPYWR